MDKKFLSTFKGLKDPDQMFDLICLNNYLAGQFDRNIPVDESREIF